MVSLLRRKSKRDRRQLGVELLEGRYVLNGQAVLVDDAFSLKENGPQTQLDVLANDSFGSEYQGAQLITSVSFGSEGGRIEIAGDGRSVLYTPPADFFGTETFVYAVDGTLTAQVSVSVQSPLTFDNYNIPPDGAVHQLDVLANDPFWPGYSDARQITAVSVGSAGGTIEIAADGKSVRYTPPDDPYIEETFIYVVDELYPAQVTIRIPETLKSDRYEFVKHESPATLNVLGNDPFWPGYTGEQRITHVTQSRFGATITIASDGKSLVYTQPADFGEFALYSYAVDSFRYVVDGAYEADVSVYLHRPVQDDSFDVDQNSTGFFFNVTQNDTYRDLSNQVHDVIDQVTSVTQSESGGTVSIAPGGQGILYTPAPGFTGIDRFTYKADGVHEARVTVNVTRPVRNDSFGTGVYQDTPGAVLNVLSNDFLGNGYTGARLITAVGPTSSGGTVTIRSDGKALLYTPAAGYTGSDTFTYTVDDELEASVTLYVTPLAQGDYFQFYPDAPQPFSLHVLNNDNFERGYSGPGMITAAEVLSGAGQVSIQNGSMLLFDPAAAGSHSIRYTVDGKYEATANVWIHNVVFGDSFVVDQNSAAQQFNVLANDFVLNYPFYFYPGPKVITGVTQSAHGGTVMIAADGKSVSYEAPDDYYGSDSFTYTVDGFMTATVSVEVIRRVRDDEYRVDAADGSQALPVLVNDLFGANYSGPGQITGVTATSGGGTATIGADRHSIVYTPAAGFVGTDTFTYTVDGALKAEVTVVVDAPASEQSPTFGSLEDYTQFLIDDALERYQYLFGQTAWVYPDWMGGPVAGFPPADSRSHSETNVQVAGVDEGDIVEFDSDFVYMLTDSEVVIVDAWPADELSVESRVEIEGRPLVEFLHGDRLTVISELGGGFVLPPWMEGSPVADRLGGPFFFEPLPSFTIVTVIDVSNRAAPEIVQTTTMEGKYVDSRGVGDFVYVLVSNPNAYAPLPEVIDTDNDPATLGRYETKEEYLSRVTANLGLFVEAALPNYTSYGPDGEMVRTGLLNAPEDIYEPLVADAFNLISVVSFDVEGDEPGLADTSAVYSTGASAIYASLDNFYVFDGDYSREDGALTRIVKFDWEPADGSVDFAATTTVAGRILNQFSADENGPYLRIATTVSNQSSGNWSGRAENMLFVLQEDDSVMEFVGGLQNLALNETMRSVRFLGDRAFVTTFRNIDPLFAIDLTDPTRPESVGHITLPGFTSYMHLVGANHLLTVGRNTPAGNSGPTQVSLFDISDLLQPLRIAEYTFERFSTSEAELDHHAFGFYAEHGLLGMPVARVFIERVDLDGDGYRETRRSVRRDDLAVFSVDVDAADPADRLVLETEIEHGTPVRRSGYIGDKLYSIANDSVKVVDIADLDTLIAELIVVEPSEEEEDPPVVVPLIGADLAMGASEVTTVFPATRTDARLLAAVNRARADLALRLQRDVGAAMLVTAEAAPDAPGGGYNLVFRAGDEHYLYRATSGLVQLVEADYEFSEAGVWHAAEFAHAAPPTQMPGDFNVDGHVDDQDHAAWRSAYGTWSLTEFLPADGNRNGIVDAADSVIWRKNLGAIVGDFDHSAAVDQGDYDTWRTSFGSTNDLRADGNYDRVVDAADYVVWRKAQIERSAGGAAIAEAAQAAAAPLSFDAVAGGEDADDSQVVVVSASRLVAMASDFVGPESARVSVTRDDAPRRLAFELVADEGDDLNLLATLELNAGDYATDASNANRLLEPATAVHAEAIDLALDSVFARRTFRALRAHW